MESSGQETAKLMTIVTPSAVYVCTTQFNVISRHPHEDTEQAEDASGAQDGNWTKWSRTDCLVCRPNNKYACNLLCSV